jgi:hypothetical protein
MKKINFWKILLLAIFHAIMPKVIKRKVRFTLTPEEHLAMGTMMTKIKYWRHFILKHKKDNKLHFTSSVYFL